MSWRGTWAPSTRLTKLEGRRGSGEAAGEFGEATFPAGTYPACSEHGAMNCVKRGEPSLWRCLADGCNIGAERACA